MTRSGFSLLELLVAIALIAAVAAIVIPNINFKTPKQEREQFIISLNNLVKRAWQHAVTSQNVSKLEFDFSKENRKITILENTGKKDEEGNLLFKPIEHKYRETTLAIPSQVSVKNFYIEGFDEVTKYQSGRQVTTWFFITPEGLSQSVIVNFFDTKSKRSVGLVLYPFAVQFKVYDSFQVPQK